MIDKPPAVEQAAPSDLPTRRVVAEPEPLATFRKALERVRRIRDDLESEALQPMSEYPGSA